MNYRINSFVISQLSCLCLMLLFVGCKEKKENETKIDPGQTVIEREPDLYQSREFTKPALFPSGIEGPAVDANGVLYAVNFERTGTIGRVDSTGEASLFVNLPEGSVGNGIRFNSKGDMFIADYTKHNILMVEMDTKEVTVFAHNNTMNQPNDIAIMDNDILFASDPDWEN